MVQAVFDNLNAKQPKNHFTVGITDDVSHTSLELKEAADTCPAGVFRGKFYGLGADGTVGANKNSIIIIGNNTDLYAQQKPVLKSAGGRGELPRASLILAYSPCIAHGINMSLSQREGKLAVESGYWPLYRFNPLLTAEGKNPFTLDSKEPTEELRGFLMNEVRFRALLNEFPDRAEGLYKKAEQDAKERLNLYRGMALSHLRSLFCRPVLTRKARRARWCWRTKTSIAGG